MLLSHPTNENNTMASQPDSSAAADRILVYAGKTVVFD